MVQKSFCRSLLLFSSISCRLCFPKFANISCRASASDIHGRETQKLIAERQRHKTFVDFLAYYRVSKNSTASFKNVQNGKKLL